MSWLITVWLLAAVATCCLQTGYVWSGLQQEITPPVLAALGPRRVLWEALQIVLPCNWATWRMYLLGPVGTAIVPLTFLTGGRQMPALAVFASGLLSAAGAGLCLAWMLRLGAREDLPWPQLTLAFILLAINVLLTAEHVASFRQVSR